jgi:protein-disulfide isomerase
VHPHAQLAAEAGEAAASQGKFWPMHDRLLAQQDALTAKDLIRYAAELGLDTDRFTDDLRNHAGQAKIAADVDSADLSGVSGTPTLSDAVHTARTRTLISSRGQPRRAS